MSGETHDRLKKLICGLKESTARDEATTDAEEKIFRDLAFVYDHDVWNTAQNNLGVVIEQYNDLRRSERFIQFKRLTAVYERNMYNKFFAPIWAVAMNADKSVGYVLSPKLTPLWEVLKDLKESYQTSDVYYDKLNKVLRLCFAPIALAIDALHTPIFNKRMMYHHRDICVDNIYMRVRKGIDSNGQENVEYDDVRLKLTQITREAHVLPNEADGLFSLTEYYHHDDVKYSGEPYDREHDWYSFGVYILEVLHLTLPITNQTGFRQIQDYLDVIHAYDSWIQSTLKKDAVCSFLLRYLDIAVKCLKLESNEHQPLSYKIPDEMKQRFLEPSQTYQMYFEYSVSMWTAQLLWMYEESRAKETPDGSDDDVCQACLLHPTERISTKQHGRGYQSKCNENCQYHCLLCYTNEERLFCSRQHGTTGTYVDHRYSYALILYGQSFEDVCRKDTESAGINPFKEEADMLAEALKSKYICGLPEGNIHVRPVYGDGTPEDCLKGHCEEMRELIHGDGNSSCSNDTSYTLFTFYFGHSYHGCDKTVGDWCPSFTHTPEDTFDPLRLKRALVHYHMTSIQKCTNYGTGLPECQAACLCANYLVNPCGPSPGSTAHRWSADKDVSISERPQPLVVTGAATCGVTDWFGQMLQGLYHRDCSGKPPLEDIQKRENYHSKCKVPLGKIDVCFKLARYIYEELGDAFIDGECLRIHQKHLKTHNGYTELMVQIDDEHCKPVLAYHKPQGVFRKVFSANEGEEQVRIDMGSETTCEKIKNALLNQIKEREQYRDKTLNIVLKSSNQLEHPIVSDDNIHDILQSFELCYDAIPLDKRVVVVQRHQMWKEETQSFMKRLPELTSPLGENGDEEDEDDEDEEESILRAEELPLRPSPQLSPQPSPQSNQHLSHSQLRSVFILAFIACLVVPLVAISLHMYMFVAEKEFPCKISDKPVEDIENYCNRITNDTQLCEIIKSDIEGLVDKNSTCGWYYSPQLPYNKARKLATRIECALTGYNQLISVSGSEMEGEGHHTELNTTLSEWLDFDRSVAFIYDVERLNNESGQVIHRVRKDLQKKYPGKYLMLLSNYNGDEDIPDDHWMYERIKQRKS